VSAVNRQVTPNRLTDRHPRSRQQARTLDTTIRLAREDIDVGMAGNIYRFAATGQAVNSATPRMPAAQRGQRQTKWKGQQFRISTLALRRR
jgi:hypothetical protein